MVSASPSLVPEFRRDSLLADRQLVIIDASVTDFPALFADIQSTSEVLLLDKERDGIAQITEFLEGFARVSSLHLVSHGTPGSLLLGNTRLNFDTLAGYFDAIANWSETLQGADVLLYGCEVAAGSMGQLFIQQLHQLTGANIAASTEKVGRTDTGLNWQLDARIGAIDTPVVFSEQLQQQYSGQFEGPTVSFELIPDFVSEEGTEAERTVTFQYTVDGEIPEGGLSVLVSGNNLGDFSSQGFDQFPDNFTNLTFGDFFDPDLNAFEVVITGAVGTFDVILANDLIQEDDTTATFFELLPDTDGVFDNPYMVDPEANIGIITTTDGVDFPTSPVVGATVDTTELTEGDEVTFTFNVDGEIPEDGLTVVVGSNTGLAGLEFDPSIIFETPEGFAGPPVVAADNIQLTLTDPNASLTLQVAEDGLPEGTETINIFLQDGEQYEIDPDNSSIDLTISDALPLVSVEIIPSEVSEEGSLEERTITFQYTVDGVVPEDGLSVLVSLDNLGDFTSQGLEVGPSNFQDLMFGEGFFPLINAFEQVILGQTGSFDVVLANDLIQEEDVDVTFFELLPDPEGLLDTPYNVNPDANIGNISITDGVEFATSPVVSLSVDQTDLTEGDQVTATFEVEGDIPEGGITVVIGSDTFAAGLEFDPAIITDPSSFTGIEFPPTIGFDTIELTITDPTATVALTVAEDGLVEGVENIEIELLDGEQYEIDPDASNIAISITDNNVPVGVGSDRRDRIFGTDADELIEGFDDSDALRGFGGNDIILAGDGNDQVFGDIPNTFGEGGDDFIDGGAGNDELRGNSGNDTLLGGAGVDRIFAGEGDDLIRGGEGDDILKGDSFRSESGNDTFVVAVGEGTDTILDFQIGEDFIGLTGELDFPDLSFTDLGGALEISAGDEALAVLNNVSESDFTANILDVVTFV